MHGGDEGPADSQAAPLQPKPKALLDRRLLALRSRRDPIGLCDPHLKDFGGLLSQCELVHKLKPRADPDFHEANPISLERLRSIRSPRNESCTAKTRSGLEPAALKALDGRFS